MDVEFFRLCPASLRRELAERASTQHFGKGRFVVSRGSVGADVYHVLEGVAQITVYSMSGREVLINTIGSGEMFGELAAIDGAPRSASVVAMSDLRLIRIAGADFVRCVELAPGIGLWLAQRLAADVRRLSDRVFELSALNVQSRVQCELLRMATGTPMIEGRRLAVPAPTHAALAVRVGTNREAVTRELRRLAEDGIIRQTGRTLEFIDVPRLQQIVSHAVG